VLALEHQGVLDVPSSSSDLSLVSHARAYYWPAGQFLPGAPKDLELLLQVVGFAAVALGDLALALSPLGRFLGGLLVLLGLAGMHLSLVAMATGLFAEALAFQFAFGAPLACGPESEDQQDGDHYDYEDDQYG
jgi:uncharacterized membrane protein YphA (DoxX/SURF4 family)